MSEIYKYAAVAALKKTNTHYTYMGVLEQFKDMLVDTDMPIILEDELTFIYMEDSMPYRKRYMKINKKRIIKKDQDMSALKTPVMAIQASILTDDDNSGLFPTDFFNSDMSHISMSGYGDAVFERYDPELDIDASLIMVPKQGKLNIEVTIMEDSQQKLENIREMWNKVRNKTAPDLFVGAIDNILPPRLAIQMLFELGLVSDESELETLTYYDVYCMLLKYTSPSFMLIYDEDTSTGVDEIIIRYGYEILVVPTIINLTPPQQEEWIKQGGMITRGFEVTFSMASMYNIHNATATNKFRDTIIDKIRSNSQVSPKVVITPTINEMGTISNMVSNVDLEEFKVEFEIGPETLIATATYNGVDEENHIIYLGSLIGYNPDIISFRNKLMEEGIDTGRYFHIIYQELINGKYVDRPREKYKINYNEMTITDMSMADNKYAIAIYMDLAEFQLFLNEVVEK